MQKFYIHKDDKQQGPFSIDELKDLKITRDAMVWFEGEENWKKASDIDEIKSLFTSIPPPITPATVTPPVLKKDEPKKPVTFIQPEKKKNKSLKYVFIIVGILVLLVGGILILKQNSSDSDGIYETLEETYQEKVMTVEEIEKSNPVKFLTADGTYNSNLFGNKLKVHGTITNQATVATYKDAVVRITYYSKTKTELGNADYTIYDIFPPNATKDFELKIENYTDVNSIGWEVVSATVN